MKRKASDVAESDNLENLEPSFLPKRAKGNAGSSFIKPQTFFLSESPSTTRPRSSMTPKPAVNQLKTGIARVSPLSAPAGRSPTRSKRSGLSSRRRTGASVSRIDPPVLGYTASSPAAPFSLNAALKGSLTDFSGLHEPETRSSWFFDIHEDTAEEEAQNMLEHHACTLDISSDEECENKRRRELEECKENVPPADDISQQSRPRPARFATCGDKMVVERERTPLRELNPRDFYAPGLDENSVVIIPDEDDEVNLVHQNGLDFAQVNFSAPTQAGPVVELVAELEPTEKYASAEELMQKMDRYAPSAAMDEPAEGTSDNFEVWESSSAKDEAEANAEC
ncbi:hypothetical protein F5B18DRAFT_641320 [Nemania serpens]|nr:hypothetical protein F5B18DRAFT_641320 [Nemania serpens]